MFDLHSDAAEEDKGVLEEVLPTTEVEDNCAAQEDIVLASDLVVEDMNFHPSHHLDVVEQVIVVAHTLDDTLDALGKAPEHGRPFAPSSTGRCLCLSR